MSEIQVKTSQQAEAMERRTYELLNSLTSEVGLLFDYTPTDDSGKKVGKRVVLANIESRAMGKREKLPVIRRDNLIAGSREAVERMAEYAMKARRNELDLDLFTGREFVPMNDADDCSND